MRFPGFEACVAMMRKHDRQTQEDGFGLLRDRAAEHVSELMAAFEGERDHGLRCWLLELIGEARSEAAVPLLAEQLWSGDDSLRDWAVRGLKKLGTKEARRLLWDARAQVSATEREAEDSRRRAADGT